MKILKNQQSFVILDSVEDLKKTFLKIEKAGRTCYQSEAGPITWESAEKFVRMILARGHESVIEHGTMSVKFINCSRGLTHELVRHRIASFSQESSRYVDYARSGDAEIDLDRFELGCVVPPHRDENEEILLDDGRKMTPVQMFQEIERYYRGLRKSGWEPEDARQILPNGMDSEIVMTANFREWRHTFAMRTSKFAHWEIRKAMGDLLEEIKKILPALVEDFVEDGVGKGGIRCYRKLTLEEIRQKKK